jgi:hypothetical protein
MRNIPVLVLNPNVCLHNLLLHCAWIQYNFLVPAAASGGGIEYEPTFWELFLFSSFGGLNILVYGVLFQAVSNSDYEGWNFNSGNYLFTTDTK